MKCTPYARNRSTLYLGIAIALSATVASGNALAQQADSAPATSGQAEVQATDLDTVTVKGYRYSIEQSLEQKRNANAVVEVITAEDVGKFPDKNVADSLQRVPGISVTISITGGMYLCAESTEKFFGGPCSSADAVATAVVSKPVAKKTTSSSVCFASSMAWSMPYTTSTFAPSAFASASDFTVPGTRSMSP